LETAYDWITVGIFAGLIVLFLQRSTSDDVNDSLWQYLGPAVGCAVTNYLGNEGLHLFAIGTLLLTLGYIFVVLKPFPIGGSTK
jgi:hypothetical protein